MTSQASGDSPANKLVCSGEGDGASIAREIFAGNIFGDFAGNLFGASFCNTVDLKFGFFFDLTTFDFTLGSTELTLLT